MNRKITKLLIVLTMFGASVAAAAPASAHDCESGSYETGDCFPDTTH